MNPFRRESAFDRAVKPLRQVGTAKVARSALTAGASVLAVSVLSAATSRLRQRQDGS